MSFARSPHTDRPDRGDAHYGLPYGAQFPHVRAGGPARAGGPLRRLSHPLTIAVVVALVCVGVVVAMRLATNAAPVPLSRELTTVDAASAAAPPPAAQPGQAPSAAEGAQRPPEPRSHQAAPTTGRMEGELPTAAPAEATPEPEPASSGRQYRDRDAEQRQAELRQAEQREAERRRAAQHDAERRQAEQRQAEQRQAEQRQAEQRQAAQRDADQRQAAQRDAEQPQAGPRAAGRGDIDPRDVDLQAGHRDDPTQMRQDMAGAICARYGISADYCREAASRYGR
jgi:hypothetical protein